MPLDAEQLRVVREVESVLRTKNTLIEERLYAAKKLTSAFGIQASEFGDKKEIEDHIRD